MKSEKIKIRKKYKGVFFKKNEVIKCINNEEIKIQFDERDSWDDRGQNLILNNSYIVIKMIASNDRYKLFIKIKDGITGYEYEDWFYPERFISLKELRNRKLKKIKCLSKTL